MTPLLTEADVAKLLNCSPRTVSRREIPVVKDGRLKRYRPEDVEAHICAKLVKPQAEQALSPPSEKESGSRAAKSRTGRMTVKLARDELNDLLKSLSRPKRRGTRRARI